MITDIEISVIGIDPGVNGGLAKVQKSFAGDISIARVMAMPMVNGRVDVDELHGICILSDFVWVEEINAHACPNATALFTLAFNYGWMLEALEHWEHKTYSIETVTPKQWMARHGLKKSGKGNKPSIKYIQQRFPDLDITKSERCRVPHNGITDAICIALYGLEAK